MKGFCSAQTVRSTPYECCLISPQSGLIVLPDTKSQVRGAESFRRTGGDDYCPSPGCT
jgi:hypothetical protein